VKQTNMLKLEPRRQAAPEVSGSRVILLSSE
jgi:hypothetical protein